MITNPSYLSEEDRVPLYHDIELPVPQKKKQMYYFVCQVKATYGPDWYLSSSCAWETFEEYAECVGDTLANVVAYTKIPSHVNEDLPF